MQIVILHHLSDILRPQINEEMNRQVNGLQKCFFLAVLPVTLLPLFVLAVRLSVRQTAPGEWPRITRAEFLGNSCVSLQFSPEPRFSSNEPDSSGHVPLSGS